MRVERVTAPASRPELVVDGPLRTAGRPYVAPRPPDQLHVVWPWKRRPGPLIGVSAYVVGCVGIGRDGFLIPALVMLLPALYVGAALLVNRHRLVLAERRITLRHEPLPWPGTRSLAIRDIDSVYVGQSGPGLPPMPQAKCGSRWFLLVHSSGQVRTLYVSEDQAQVYALQRFIEHHLGLNEPDPELELDPEPDSEDDLHLN
jgi:hypothetical protein